MKQIIFILTVLQYTSNLLSQTHGTLVIAAIGSDGIMIAADSRLEFGRPAVAYTDEFPKIVTQGRYTLGCAGLAIINDTFMLIHFKVFADKKNGSLKSTMKEFIDYIHKKNPQEAGDNRFIGASYENGKPVLELMNYGHAFDEQKVASTSQEAGNFFTYKENLTCLELGRKAEKAINDFKKFYHYDYQIGGPISILKINPQNIVSYIQNDFSGYKYMNTTKFINAIKSNKIKVIFVGNNTLMDVLKIITTK